MTHLDLFITQHLLLFISPHCRNSHFQPLFLSVSLYISLSRSLTLSLSLSLSLSYFSLCVCLRPAKHVSLSLEHSFLHTSISSLTCTLSLRRGEINKQINDFSAAFRDTLCDCLRLIALRVKEIGWSVRSIKQGIISPSRSMAMICCIV